jgi:DNA-binding transcriptional MerR regulator
MLRHYDATGLLRPARVDPASGYRFYAAAQLARLNRIIALKDLGFTLEQVRSLLDQEVSADQLAGMLRLRRAELEAQIAADTARLTQVEARLRIIQLEGTMPANDIKIKSVPAVTVAELTAVAPSLEPASIGPVIKPLYAELGDRLGRAGLTPCGPGIAWYEDGPDDTVVVHASLPVNAEPDGSTGVTMTTLPQLERAATIVHRGSMDHVLATIQTLGRWVEAHGYRPAGHPREVYLDCPDDQDQWVTELQEPLG